MTDLLRNIFLYDPSHPLLFTQFYFWAFFAIVYALFALIVDFPTAKRSNKARLTANGQRLTANGLFDLVFMDADKREYCTYLELVYPLVPVGGFILADNTLWDGHVIDPAYDKDKQTLGLRAFNEQLAHDERFEQVILPIRDGLTLIRKIK